MDSRVPALDIQGFGISRARGFLPERNPIAGLPSRLHCWSKFYGKFPKYLATGSLREAVRNMPVVDLSDFGGSEVEDAHVESVMSFFSFLGHAWVYENWRQEPEKRIPKCIALPWCQIAKKLGRPPVLSYASYALDNWSLLENVNLADAPKLGKTALINNFLGGMDEEWFILIHIDIEVKAAPAIAAIGEAQLAALNNSLYELMMKLHVISNAIEDMHDTLCRMPENCDPYIYYNRVRPYITGFLRNPVIYEGVEEYGEQPQRFFGETGAQSSVMPSLDAALGIEHKDQWPENFIIRMRDYMPPGHRLFIEAVEQGPSIKQCVLEHRELMPELWNIYSECVERLRLFRDKHLEYAALYINKQAQISPHNPVDYGTGGTPMMPYLAKHRDDTTAEPNRLKEESNVSETQISDTPCPDNSGDGADGPIGSSRVSQR